MLQGYTMAIVPCGNPTPKKLPTGGGEWPTFRTARAQRTVRPHCAVVPQNPVRQPSMYVTKNAWLSTQPGTKHRWILVKYMATAFRYQPTAMAVFHRVETVGQMRDRKQ